MSRTFRWILVASAALKLTLAVVFGDLPPRYDEHEFLQFGRAIFEGESGPSTWRAPGYQAFVALGLALAGGKVLGVRLLQVVLSVVSSFLVYRTGLRLQGERTALLAGGFVAFYPSHVAFSHLLWAETLYGFLILVAFERLLAWKTRPSVAAPLTAGLALGLASLTRSVGIGLLGASLLWVLLQRERPDRRRVAAIVLAAAATLILPWSLWASVSAGSPVVIDTNAGFNLWSGNNPRIPPGMPSLWSVGLPLDNGLDPRVTRFLPDESWRHAVPPEMARDGVEDPHGPDGDLWYRKRAFSNIAARPGDFLSRIPARLSAFWAPDFFLPRHLLRDWYGPAPGGLTFVVWIVTWLAAAVPLILGPAALACVRAGPFRSLALSWGFAYLAIHAVTYGHSRMHQPLVPILVLAVAAVVGRNRERTDRRILLVRGVPWAGLALGAWLLALPIVAGAYLMPSPRHAEAARVLGGARHLPLPARERAA